MIRLTRCAPRGGAVWRRRRALLAGTTVLMLAAGLLGGCASSGGASASSGGKITLTDEDWYPPATFTQGAGIQWLFNEFHKTHPNITIKREISPGPNNLIPKLLNQATTNSLPDIAIIDNEYMPSIDSTGKLLNVSGDLHGGPSAYLAGQKSIATGPTGLNGIFIGVVTLAIFYNKDMFKAAGITQVPQTWDQFAQDAKKLTTSKTYGFLFGGGQDQCATWQFNPWQWSAGGTDLPLNSAGTVKALNFWHQLVASGATPKSVVNSCQDDTYQKFATGQAAMVENGAWDIAPLAKTKINYGIFSIPVPTSSATLTLPLGGEMFTLPNTGNSAREKAANEFLAWSQQPSILTQFDQKIGYVPAQTALWPSVLKKNPAWAPFVNSLAAARGRTDVVKAKYPQWAQAMSTAISQTLLGQKSAAAALSAAQSSYQAG
jgi:multiple sugar transport system substrate-binding protein